jgi:hypothetical protein
MQWLERCNAALKTPSEIREKGNSKAEKDAPDRCIAIQGASED